MGAHSKEELDQFYNRINFRFENRYLELIDFDFYSNLYCLPNQFYYVVDYVKHKVVIAGGNVEGITGFKVEDFNMNVLLNDLIFVDNHTEIIDLSLKSYQIALKYKNDWNRKGLNDYLLTASYRIVKKNKSTAYVLRNTKILSRDSKGNVIHGLTFITDVSGNLSLSQDSFTAYVVSPFGEYIHLTKSKNENILTNVERNILTMLYKGDRSKQIAQRLSISPHTVDTHRRRLLRKLGATNTPELINKSLLQGLIK